MNKKLIQMIAALVIVGWVGGAAFAVPWWGGQGKRPDPGGQIAKRLKLTTEQQAKFKTARENLDKESQPVFAKIKARAEQLRTEMEKDKPDLPVIEQSIREINGWRTEIEIKRVKSLLELKANLTPEQRKNFQELMKPPHMSKKAGERPGGLPEQGMGPPPPDGPGGPDRSENGPVSKEDE